MTTPPDISKLYARAGEPVTASKWNALISFIERLLDALGRMIGPGLIVDEGAGGFFLRAETSAASFVGAFAVSVGGNEVTIGTGTVDDIVPAIGSTRIDDAESPPKLKIEGEPNAQLRSWIALQATVDPEAEKFGIDAEDPAALQVIHTNDLAAAREEHPSSCITAVAVLIWTDTKTISSVHQILWFDQKLTITQNDAGALQLAMSAAA